MRPITHWFLPPAPSPPFAQQPSTDHALSLPDILLCIFAYLSQSELRLKTSFVSKSWRQFSIPLIHRSFGWVDFDYKPEGPIPDSVINALKSNLNSFIYRAPSILSTTSNIDLVKEVDCWRALCPPASFTALDKFVRDTTTGSSSSSSGSSHWISLVRDLQVFGDIHVEDRFLPFVTTCRNITSLSMMLGLHKNIDLATLLNICSKLTYLSIRSMHEPKGTPARQDTISATANVLLPTYPLRHLILERVKIEQEPLNELLKHLPQLLHFNAIELAEGPSMSSLQLVKTLMAHCPLLRGFAFNQFRGEDAGDHEIGLLMRYYVDTLTDLGLCNRAIWHASLRSVARHARNLTTLRIHSSMGFGAVRDIYVLSFLCNAPNLEHFYALETELDPQSFVQCNIRGTYEWRWNCHKLKSLHLGFSNHHFRTYAATTSIYSFLVKHCPKLEDLCLRPPTYTWGSMEGGMKILTGLQELRDLTFHVDRWRNFGPVTLDWMVDRSKLSLMDHPLEKTVRPVLDWLNISKRARRLRRFQDLNRKAKTVVVSPRFEDGIKTFKSKDEVKNEHRSCLGIESKKQDTAEYQDKNYWPHLTAVTIHCRVKQDVFFRHAQATFNQQHPQVNFTITPTYRRSIVCRIF
ncbi:hypothetical protein BG004_004536 [Podila humilis]|nr:hypothetical protein BG004_004536 [Podila humilis]